MSALLLDLRGAWRLILRYRTSSILILLTLALGLGANVAVLAISRGVLLRPLPYERPEELMMLWVGREPAPAGSQIRGVATAQWFRELHARQRSFSSISAIELWSGNPSASFDLALSDGAERLRGAFATPSLFPTIGVDAVIGRTFTDSDPADVAVISSEIWQRLFGGTRDIVGRRIELATGRGKERAVRALTIVGVLPPRVQFSYPESTDFWLPLTSERIDNPRTQGAVIYRIVARLRPGVTLAQAEQDMSAAKATTARDLGQNMERRRFWLEPVHENAVGATRPAMRLLAAVALLVFLVACLNVAALLLAQTAERRRAIALQLAIGASRRRIVQQLLTETTLIALMAAIGTVALVAALQPLLRAIMPPSLPRADEIGVDMFTIAWTSALLTLAVGLSSLIPTWRGSRLDPGVEFGQSSRTSTITRSAVTWRQVLVAAQVAVVVVLVVAGGLLLHSFWKLQRVDLGFDGERVFTAEMRLLSPRYFDSVALRSFHDELLARVRALSGVERASITSSVPLRGVDWMRAFAHRGAQRTARERDIDPEYFAVMGVPLLSGRTFTAADAESAAPVAIVSQSLATQMYPGENPLGQSLPLSAERPHEIIGVVGDVRNLRVESAGEPAYYVPRAQRSSELICLVVRAAPNAGDLAAPVRAIVASIDPMQPVLNAMTMADVVSDSTADRRFYAIATVAFGLVTLFVAAAGLYGVTAYSIAARTREIGVRVALGARPTRVIRLLASQYARPVVLGTALGLVIAFWACRLLEQFLFEVRSFDAVTYALAAAAVLLLAVLACVLPSIRAARLSPIAALRQE